MSGPAASSSSRWIASRTPVSGVFELVAHRGDEVALHLVEQAQPRDVLQHHGGAELFTVRIANRQDARQEGALGRAGAEQERLLEALRQEVTPAGQRVGQWLAQAIGRVPDRAGRVAVVLWDNAEQTAGGRIGHLDEPAGIEDEDRVGKRVDRRLARLLGAQQAIELGAAIIAEPAGHRVERLRQFAELAAGELRHDLIEIARSNAARRPRHGPDRPHDVAHRAPGEQAGEQHRQRDAARQPRDRAGRRRLGIGAGLFHVGLVELQDRRRRGLDFLVELVQPVRPAGLAETIRFTLRREIRQLPERVALPAIFGAQRRKTLNQRAFVRQRDIALFLLEVNTESLPCLVEMRARSLLRLAQERELKRRVDALQRLVEALHVQDAVVVFAEDDVDTAAEPLQQHDAGAAQDGEQDHQGQQRQEDALTQGHRHGGHPPQAPG